jgi:hypothetical protein
MVGGELQREVAGPEALIPVLDPPALYGEDPTNSTDSN